MHQQRSSTPLETRRSTLYSRWDRSRSRKDICETSGSKRHGATCSDSFSNPFFRIALEAELSTAHALDCVCQDLSSVDVKVNEGIDLNKPACDCTGSS